MVVRQPGRALTYAVMARVREGDAARPRRFVWAAAAATVVLWAAVAIALVNRAPLVLFPPAPPAHALVIAPTLVAVSPITIADSSTGRRPDSTVAFAAGRVSLRLPRDVSSIDAIQTEPIDVSAIEVPQLPRDVTVIEAITIDPLTIEPLAASND